jgi:hypothetical protein
MPAVIHRRSNLAPPPWRVYEALVDELEAWWISLGGEATPLVLWSKRPDMITWSSPFARWPDAEVHLRLVPGGGGCIVQLEQTIQGPAHALVATALRHRWGEHLDRDLREWLDDGWPPTPYHVSAYRPDVEDWSIRDHILEGQLWRTEADLWSWVDLDFWDHRRRSEHELPAGTVLSVLGFKHHRMAVHCVVEEPSDLEKRLVPELTRNAPQYRGYEIIVPVAEFSNHLRLELAQ